MTLAPKPGVLDIAPERVIRKGRLQPGRMFLVDTEQGRIIDDKEIKLTLADAHPYEEWLESGTTNLEDLAERDRKSTRLNSSHVALSRMPSSA